MMPGASRIEQVMEVDCVENFSSSSVVTLHLDYDTDVVLLYWFDTSHPISDISEKNVNPPNK